MNSIKEIIIRSVNSIRLKGIQPVKIIKEFRNAFVIRFFKIKKKCVRNNW